MTFQNFNKTVLFSIFTLIAFSSCSSSDSDTSNDDPILQEDYYFKGFLDGEPLNIKKEIFNPIEFNDPNAVSIDFGGSLIHDIDFPEEPETGSCYSRYACGLMFAPFQENPDQLDTAKMYFSRLPLIECTSENEYAAMNDFFALNTYPFNTFPGNDVNNNISFDFFPAEFPNQEDYYSSRFGDNTDASFEITSAIEIEDSVYIVEGNFSCKLYKFSDATDFKELTTGEFKIKILKNLEE